MAGVVITKCVICKEWIKPTEYGWTHGNNAAPVVEGRCCDDCNKNVVIPTRLRLSGAYPYEYFRGEE